MKRVVCISFDIFTESGVYGDPEDPSEEYFRVTADARDCSVVFEKAVNSTYDFTVRRPLDFDSEDFLETAREDPQVYANSMVQIVPEFPVGDDNYRETTFMMYGSKSLEERQSHAIVDIFLDEKKGDEKIRWVNTDKEQENADFTGEIWYIGTELRERPVIDYFSHKPFNEQMIRELFEDASFLIEQYDFILE